MALESSSMLRGGGSPTGAVNVASDKESLNQSDCSKLFFSSEILLKTIILKFLSTWHFQSKTFKAGTRSPHVSWRVVVGATSGQYKLHRGVEETYFPLKSLS